MKRGPLPATAGLALVLMVNSGGCLYRYHDAACKQRGAALSASVEELKKEAHEKLKVGTKKDDVVRFFKENGIPVTYSREEVSGTIKTTGCAPSGCGSDDALLGLRVKVDQAGTVLAEPHIFSFYTNCL